MPIVRVCFYIIFLLIGIQDTNAANEGSKPKRAVLLISFVEGLKNEIGTTSVSLQDLIARSFYEYIETEFKGLSVRVHLAATQTDLFNELNDSENFLVAWISHSNSFNKDSETVLRVWDKDNRIVTPLFTKVSSQVKIVVVLGCNNDLLTKDWQKNNPNTFLFLPARRFLPVSILSVNENTLLDTLKGIPIQRIWSKYQLTDVAGPFEDHEVLTIKVRRWRPLAFVSQSELPSVRIDSFDESVNMVMPPMSRNEKIQESKFYIAVKDLKIHKLNFIVIDPLDTSQDGPRANYQTMGEFEFRLDYKGKVVGWQPFDIEATLTEGLSRYSYLVNQSELKTLTDQLNL
jgi:hypothetical protein